MEISRDKVFISLSYSPRTATLKRKFGNLPIGYMRERIDKEEDFKILDRVGRRYHFNLLDEQVAGLDNTWMEGKNENCTTNHQRIQIFISIFTSIDSLQKYGVNNMKISRDKVFISLSYSPRTATLKRKFGNLPVRYMRERIDMEEDFKILERVGRRYNFNLLDEQVEGGKRRLYHQPPTLLVDDTDDDDDDTGGYVNEVNVSRLSRHQVKRNKGEAST
nr:unnamed protein product [Callosobruchus analis]